MLVEVTNVLTGLEANVTTVKQVYDVHRPAGFCQQPGSSILDHFKAVQRMTGNTMPRFINVGCGAEERDQYSSPLRTVL